MTEAARSASEGPVDAPMSGTFLCFAVLAFGCASRSAPRTPPAPPTGSPVEPTGSPVEPTGSPVEPRVSALLDVASDKEANVLAVIKGSDWQPAAAAGAAALKRLATRGAAYQVLPTGNGGGAVGVRKGELPGSLREDCGEYYFALAAPSAARGFAVVSTGGRGDPVLPVQLQSAKVEPAYAVAVAKIIARASKLKGSPTIERAYRVDLDGNGKPEVILQASHPDLNGDPPHYKPQYYSLIIVLPDVAGAEPVFTGYLQAAKDMADFEVLTLDSVADIDLDGKRELLVRARHAEGWQTQVFRYDGKLRELFHSVGGEGQCPDPSK